MSAIQHFFIEPLDVLILRGNKLFGDPGSFGESLMPPWPSVAAGALRSALLVARNHDPARFAQGTTTEDSELGTPEHPGSFTVAGFQLARRHKDGLVEPLYALPADLTISKYSENHGNRFDARRLTPRCPTNELLSSACTNKLAVLQTPERSKPVSGFWLTADGWRKHVNGETIEPGTDLVPTEELWQVDHRVGVGLDPVRGRADSDQGKLFSLQAIAMRCSEHGTGEGLPFDAGFMATITGADLPDRLDLRFGGDGRAAIARRTDVEIPEPDFEAIARSKRCRLILTTPGIFEDGWRPTGAKDVNGALHFDLHGVRGRIVSAAVPRSTVVSGFDLAKWRPKPAERAVPTGSVYWLEELEASPESLRHLVHNGLWHDPLESTPRRAEGFNRLTLASY